MLGSGNCLKKRLLCSAKVGTFPSWAAPQYLNGLILPAPLLGEGCRVERQGEDNGTRHHGRCGACPR